MATVIRVKRRVDEEPLNAFVLNCKKRKYDDVNDDAVAPEGAENDTSATVVKFAGTVDNQENIASHLKKLNKSEAIDVANRVRRPINVAARNRFAQKQNAQEDRFKIVNCFRTQNDEATSAAAETTPTEGESQKVTVVDIERNPSAPSSSQKVAPAFSSSSTPSQSAPIVSQGAASHAYYEHAEPDYVYDLYLPDENVQTPHMDIFIEDLLSVEPFNEELTYGAARDNGLYDSSDDSEDSNDECNYRNEYPDTEEEDEPADDDSVTEHDMRKQFQSMDIDELSSDDDGEASGSTRNGFVYSIDPEGVGFEDDLDDCDVNRYGEAYARYKARIIKKNRIVGSDDDDEDDDDGDRNTTNDDSDAGSAGSDADNYYSD